MFAHHLINDGKRALGNCQVLVCFALDLVAKRRHDAEIDIHRLEIADAGTLPGICIGSAVGAGLAAFQGIDCYVPHGGFIVALATSNVGLFCLDIVIGALVGAAILVVMKPKLENASK